MRTCSTCEYCVINTQHDDIDDCVKRIKNRHKVLKEYKTGEKICPVYRPYSGFLK